MFLLPNIGERCQVIQLAIDKIQVLRHDPHMRDVARGALLAFALKIAGAGLAFAFNIVIARLLGAEGAGLYFLALSVAVIGSVIGRLGLDDTLLRFVALHAARSEWAEVHGAYGLGMRAVVAVAGLISLLGYLSAPWMAETFFDKPALGTPLQWMSLSILPFAMINLQAESLKGLKRVRDAMFVQSIGIPLVGLMFIWPLYLSSGVEGVALAYLVATVVVTGVGALAWKRGAARTGVAKFYPYSRIWASCRSLFLSSLISKGVLPWAPFLLLGIWTSSEEVGIFGVANRVVLLVGFLLGAVNVVLSPKFAELYVKKDMLALEQTSKRVALGTTLLATPLLVTLVLGGEWILDLFGKDFSRGATVLAILAVGQYVNIFCGSVGQLLVMSGNEADAARGMILLAAVLLLTSALLMPFFGMVGGAVSTSLSLIVWNVWMAAVARKRLGFNPVPI